MDNIMSRLFEDILRKIVLLLWGAALLMAGCSESDPATEGLGAAPDGEVEFVFDLSAARAAIGEDGSGEFEDGDRIGVYVYGYPTRHFILTLENGAWRPKLKKSDLGDGKISAYYPAREDVRPEENRHIHAVASDQSGEGYAESDMLWAHREIDLSTVSNRIELPFAHGMHRLKIRLTSADGELPEDLSVEVRNRNEGSFSLFTGTPQDPETDEVWITPHAGEQAGEFTALLFPQKLAPYTSGDGWLRIHAGDRTIMYNAPNEIGGSKSFEAGKTTTLDLRLTDGNVEPGPEPEPDPGTPDPAYANTIHWVYGVDGLDYPRNGEDTVPEVSPVLDKFPSGKWFRASGREYFNWQTGYGWYDCDKNNPEMGSSRPGYEDWNMCWAASASNLIHWWMYHNREYIKMYDEKYGVDPWPKYPRPSYVFSDKEDSEVFDFFRETCRNVGGSAHYGVNWFIAGTSGVPANSQGVYDNFGGYFSKLFDHDVATNYKSLRKDNFNRIVKDAFEHDRALGFDIGDPYGGAHAMVIWGAEFDDTGYVSAIYYVDNNDHFDFEIIGIEDQTSQRHRLIRREITYRDSGVYMGTSQVVVNALNEIDLGRDVWEREFGKLLDKI